MSEILWLNNKKSNICVREVMEEFLMTSKKKVKKKKFWGISSSCWDVKVKLKFAGQVTEKTIVRHVYSVKKNANSCWPQINRWRINKRQLNQLLWHEKRQLMLATNQQVTNQQETTQPITLSWRTPTYTLATNPQGTNWQVINQQVTNQQATDLHLKNQKVILLK